MPAQVGVRCASSPSRAGARRAGVGARTGALPNHLPGQLRGGRTEPRRENGAREEEIEEWKVASSG